MSVLLRQVQIPRMYDAVPDDPASAALYCSLMLRVLQDALSNCVLLVDPENLMTGEMFQSVRRWPPKYRHRCQELLRELRKRNRFVKLDASLPPVLTCGRAGCGKSLEIASSQGPDIVLAPTDCQCCSTGVGERATTVHLIDYGISHFSEIRSTRERVELADGEMTREEFERIVWVPLFRYAKHVKVFDRNIGHQFVEQVRRGSSIRVKENYARTLEWMFGLFAQLSEGRTGVHFEVTCGLDADIMSNAQMGTASDELHSFAERLAARYGGKIEMRVKVESERKMRHARFVVTDQVALMVERGFDLLRTDGLLRDVVITHTSSAGQIEAEVRTLDDAPRGALSALESLQVT